MTIEHVIKLLVDREREVGKRRNHALARGNWPKAIECDAIEAAYSELRNTIAMTVDEESKNEHPTS